MKKIIVLLLIVISLSSFKYISSKYEPFEKLFIDLVEPDSDKLFRGIDFDMSKTDIRNIELKRATCTERKAEKDEQLLFEVDMGHEVLDFADIIYYVDDKGLYYVEVETYAITPQKSDYVFNKVKEFYTAKLGIPKLADDGYWEFKGATKEYNYIVSITQVDLPPTEDDEGSYGMYLLIAQD